jgi:6-phosphogluconolactonase
MKFNTINRTAKAVALSLALGLGTIACSRDYTAAYVYSVSNTTGQVSAFAVDYQSGVLTQISGSPFASNLTNPTTVIAAPNGKTLYEIGGSQNANVEVFSVGSDGKLYGQATPNLTGTYPTAAAIDPTGSFLYVLYTYQPGFTPVSPGPGGITMFPIKSDGTLGTAVDFPVLGNNPVGIVVSATTCTATPALSSTASGLSSPNCILTSSGGSTSTNNGYTNTFVYAVDAEGAGATANGVILGFVESPTSGALTAIPGTIAAGVAPSAIATDPTGKYVYVTDKQQNEVFGYQIDNATPNGIAGETTAALNAINNSPFATGGYPVAITIEPRGKYVYVANYNSSTVSSYSLNLGNGSLGASAGSGFTTNTGPTCVTVEPALGIYLYTSNYLDASVSGGQLSPDTGQLTGIANSPFPTVSQPTCLTSVANGAHAIQVVTP